MSASTPDLSRSVRGLLDQHDPRATDTAAFLRARADAAVLGTAERHRAAPAALVDLGDAGADR